MNTHFDVLVLGTGLTQSITAAALAKAGFRVLHVDENPYYGGNQASLSHDELLQWSQSPPPSVSAVSVSSSSPLPFSRSYSLSLAPALIPSSGPLIVSLILSGVSRYGQFKLLDAVYVFRRNALHRVPGNKEDIFKARDVSLIDKRKLMRFLQFAAGEFENALELQGQDAVSLSELMRNKFSLGDDAVEGILYALAYCFSPTDSALPALIRLRRYLRSAGRYGNSPFLVGHFGGLGEIAQGFCRTCAVNGGTYILGRKVLTLRLPSRSDDTDTASFEAARASIKLENVPDILTADFVITGSEYIPSLGTGELRSAYACCVAITDRPMSITSLSPEPPGVAPEADLNERLQPDTAIVVFPPGSLLGGNALNAVRILQMGEATLSCPRGRYVLYLCTRTEEEPEKILRPYLSSVTSTDERPQINDNIEFSLFYTWRESNVPSSRQPRTLVVCPPPEDWSEIADHATEAAETLFWETVKALSRSENEVETFWPLLEAEEDEEDTIENW